MCWLTMGYTVYNKQFTMKMKWRVRKTCLQVANLVERNFSPNQVITVQYNYEIIVYFESKYHTRLYCMHLHRTDLLFTTFVSRIPGPYGTLLNF